MYVQSISLQSSARAAPTDQADARGGDVLVAPLHRRPARDGHLPPNARHARIDYATCGTRSPR
jgi:hypothetical protein